MIFVCEKVSSYFNAAYFAGEKKRPSLPSLSVAPKCKKLAKLGHFTHFCETDESPDKLNFYFQHNNTANAK